MHRAAARGARADDVQRPVVVEVVDDDAAGGPDRVEPELRRDVDESADVLSGIECRSRDQVLRRHFCRIPAADHVSDIQQPLHLQIVRQQRQVSEEVSDRLLGVVGPGKRLGMSRQQTPRPWLVINAIVDLGLVQVRDAEHLHELRDGVRRLRLAEPQRALELLDRFRHAPVVGVKIGRRDVHLDDVERRGEAKRLAARRQRGVQ
jgi:hypothetical protein